MKTLILVAIGIAVIVGVLMVIVYADRQRTTDQNARYEVCIFVTSNNVTYCVEEVYGLKLPEIPSTGEWYD